MIVYVVKHYHRQTLYGIYSTIERAKKAAEDIKKYWNYIGFDAHWVQEVSPTDIRYGNEDHNDIIQVTTYEVNQKVDPKVDLWHIL